MEYSSSLRRPPTIIRSHTDDENHSIFDFPIDPSVDGGGDDDVNEDADDASSFAPGDSSPTTQKKKQKQRMKALKKKEKTTKKKKVVGSSSNNNNEDRPFSPSSPTSDTSSFFSSSSKDHPYPSSISIQVNGNSNNVTTTSNKGGTNEFRSPSTSPGCNNYGNDSPSRRQPNSPDRNTHSLTSVSSTNNETTTTSQTQTQLQLMKQHHIKGIHYFNCNRLSEAVDSFSVGIRVGLQEIRLRKDIVLHMQTNSASASGGGTGGSDTSTDNCGGGTSNNNKGKEQDGVIVQLSNYLVTLHIDLGKTLFIAAKYNEANIEYNNALGLLVHTCHLSEEHEQVKNVQVEINKVQRALEVEVEREKMGSKLSHVLSSYDDKLQQQQSNNNSNNKSSSSSSSKKNDIEKVYKHVTSQLQKALRLERNSQGEHSYAYAKLVFKLCKIKLQHAAATTTTTTTTSTSGSGSNNKDINLYNDILQDSNMALQTFSNILGTKHTLFGIGCNFVASVYEKKLLILERQQEKEEEQRLSSTYDENNNGGTNNNKKNKNKKLSKECKDVISKMIGLYTDALVSLQYKYTTNNDNDNSNDNDTKMVPVQPEIAEVYHKIAKLYTKKSSSSSSKASEEAVNAYHKSLHAYGYDTTTTTTKKKNSNNNGDSHHNYHSNVKNVWYNLSQHYMLLEEYNDAVYAALKCVELCKIDGGGSSENDKMLQSCAYTVAGDGYTQLSRYNDSCNCYQEAYYMYNNNSSDNDNNKQFKSLPLSKSSSNGGNNKNNKLIDNSNNSNVVKARLLHKLGMSYYHRTQMDDARVYLIDALRTLRSSSSSSSATSTSASSSSSSLLMPTILRDIGQLHITCNEYTNAMKVLRSCLKLYTELGYSNHENEIVNVRQLYDEAVKCNRRGGSGGSKVDNIVDDILAQQQQQPPVTPTRSRPTITSSSLLLSSSSSSNSNNNATITPASGNSNYGSTATQSFMATPRSNATSVTHPSTNYSRSTTRSSEAGLSASSGGGGGQLQTLLEEFTMDHNDMTVLSPMHTSHHDGEEEEEDNKSSARKGEGVSSSSNTTSYEVLVQQLKVQLEQVTTERNNEKKQRIIASTQHRKEIESMNSSKLDNNTLQREVQQLRNQLNVSETSYQQLVLAIDDEKDRLNKLHDGKVQELQNEIDTIKQEKLKHPSGDKIEYSRLFEELSSKKHEISVLTDKNQKLSQEVTTVTSTNHTLTSKNDSLTKNVSLLKNTNDSLKVEVQRLSSEVAKAKAQVAYDSVNHQHSSSHVNTNNSGGNNSTSMEMKNLEFELQSERNRRMILESSLQKEYDRGGGNVGGVGGYAAPYPMMPFGCYPPMMMGGGGGNNNDSNNFGKMKTLEIDLATEKASKEMLNNVIVELRTTHENEKEVMQSQYASFISTHERECSNLMTKIGEQNCEIEELSSQLSNVNSKKDDIVHQLDGAMCELSDVKEQLKLTSCELSSIMEEKMELSTKVRRLERTEDDYIKTKEELRMVKSTLMTEKECRSRKESECTYLQDDNDRIKKEYSEAIQLFESEMDKVKSDRDDIRTELECSKGHLQRVMQDLEAIHTETQHCKMTLKNSQKDGQSKTEQLRQAKHQIKVLTQKHDELESKASKLQDIVTFEKKTRTDTDRILDETQDKLSMAERTIEEFNKTSTSLKSERDGIQTRLVSLEELNKELNTLLHSIPRQLEAVLPANFDLTQLLPSATTTRDDDGAPNDDEYEKNLSQELKSRISTLLYHICAYNKELNEVIKSKDGALDKTEWNLSNTAKDLDTLEEKHNKLKEELAEMGYLQNDYDELLEQYELVVEEKEKLDECIKTLRDEKDRDANDSLSRLKEAVDDLEELERERDTIQAELTRVQSEFVKKEILLNDRIIALETDNKLIETLETQALEYDAALSQKDERLKKLYNELQLVQAELGTIKRVLEEDGAYPELRLSREEPSSEENYDEMYPDILINDETLLSPSCSTKTLTVEHLATNPFADDESDVDKKDDNVTGTNPFADDSSEEEEEEEEEEETKEVVTSSVEAAVVDHHQKEVLEKSRVIELETIIEELNQKVKSSQGTGCDDIERERQALEEVEALKDYIAELEVTNQELNAQLFLNAGLQKDLEERNESHRDKVDTLEQSNVALEEELRMKQTLLVEQSSALARESSEEVSALLDEITLLKNKILTLEEQLTYPCQTEENDQGDQMDLQVAINEREDSLLELATVNAQLHNAMASIDDLKKENDRLKSNIKKLAASNETEEDKNFEVAMNAAHVRFESMEQALQDRVARLEREKDKLVADYNIEMTKKEDEHTQTKIELSAWKLEMQNALNDIESLKKERDELKAQMQSFSSTES